MGLSPLLKIPFGSVGRWYATFATSPLVPSSLALGSMLRVRIAEVYTLTSRGWPLSGANPQQSTGATT